MKKTKIVVFKKSKRSSFDLDRVYFNGQVVDIVHEYTYLFFVLDENLSFISHAKRLIQASISKVNTLSKV